MPVVNSDILVWARESAGYDLAEAARRLSLRDTKTRTAVDKLSDMERGKPPSRSMLVRMAKQYHRPLLAFYMKAPPRKSDRGEDYRTLYADVEPAQDALVDALVRNIKVRQTIVRAALISEGDAEGLVFIGSYNIGQGVGGLADQIRKTCGIDLNTYRGQANQEQAFKYLRERVESAGIFTILAGNLGSHHTNLDVNVFRGFALSDRIAPVAVINDQDAKAAWSFTLLHEVAHLWLGATGISGGTGERAIERFCNEVAAELLLPLEDIVSRFGPIENPTFEVLTPLVDEFATQQKVSGRMVAYRLLVNHIISDAIYSQLAQFFYQRWRDTRDQQRQRARETEGGPSYYTVKQFKLGSALLGTAQRMLRSGELSTTQVAALLGVRALNVGNLIATEKAA